MKCKRLADDAFLFKTTTGEYLVEVCSDIAWFYLKIHQRRKWLFWFNSWKEVCNTRKISVPKLPENVLDWVKTTLENYENTLPQYQWFDV